MHLSVPVYRLKRQARMLSRTEGIPYHQALDRVARREGFRSWSLLAARAARSDPARRILGELAPGNLLLVGARPGQGKTRLGLQLAVEAIKAGGRGVFFSLEYGAAELAECFAALGLEPGEVAHGFEFDGSDDISGPYMIQRLQRAERGTLVVIDYLQLLDQKREHPDLMEQVGLLKAFAEARGLVLVFIAQIHRRYDPARKPIPGLEDVRLPNPLDLTLFDKTCFMHDGEMRLAAVG